LAWVWVIVLILLVFFNYKFYKNKIFFAVLIISILGICFQLLAFEYNKYSFFNRSISTTSEHLIVGFRNDLEILDLVKRNKIAGVYFSSRNVKNKNKEEIKSFIKNLQSERKKHSQKELIIVADQEGGIVSHLSPILTRTESLNSSYNNRSIKKVAQTHAQEMQNLGFNLNLSPVADLESSESAKGYSQIAKRSVSNSPESVIEATTEYCQELYLNGVKCTLKHFPGIGDVTQDTHFELGVLDKTRDDLYQQTKVFKSPGVEHYVMFSHTIVKSIDSENPASTSKEFVNYFRNINPEAKIITDDMSMLPISKDIGIKKAYQKSLNAGIEPVCNNLKNCLKYKNALHIRFNQQTI
jgi:beta-N-acetylhexosaminidase